MSDDTSDRGDRLISVIYSSRAQDAFSGDDLGDLLAQSRANNDRAGLTGMLLYRDGRFIQLLEGDEAAVRERLAVIRADERHHDVAILVEEPVETRQFPEWSMGFPVAAGTDADRIPGYRSSFDDLDADGGEAVRAIRELTRWFQQRDAR